MPEGAPAGDESKGTVENKSTVEKKDRTEFWLDVGKAVGMPLAALILGFVFNYSLSKSQARDSDMRLYTEMMGRREQADSDLRKDMFKAVLDKFMSNNEKMKGPEKLDQQILELELLAYNFHESLDIGPLFKNLHRQILSLNGAESAEMRDRLEDLAQEVKAQQLSVLTGMERFGTDNQASANSKADLRTDVQLPTIDAPQGNVMSGLLRDEPQNLEGPETLYCLYLDSGDHPPLYRQFKLAFTRYSVSKRELEVWLRVSRALSKSDCQKEYFNPLRAEVDTRFWVGLFAFPMIDNTRLSDGERCAVTVGEINEPHALPVRLSYFPESRASLKDKPYYDEVIKQMAGKAGP